MIHERAKTSNRKREYNNLYYIDFPVARDFFQPWFFNSLSKLLDKRDYQNNFDKGFISSKEGINPAYYSYQDIDWTTGSIIVFWASSLIPLPIHVDVDYRFNDYALGNGVNFNLFNNSLVNFYDEKDLIQTESGSMKFTDGMTENDKIIVENYNKSSAKTYITDKSPKESYKLKADDTYIINTMTPHQFFADPGRICVSVRLKQFNNTPWELMFNSFKHSIKR